MVGDVSRSRDRRISDLVGRTPLIRLEARPAAGVQVYAKLEFFNPTGSVKDRAAEYVIGRLVDQGFSGSTIVESSSGNFGIALANVCRRRGLPFNCVVDPFISAMNEYLIRAHGAMVTKVDQIDVNGGYLLSRLARVRQLVADGAYWVNQYGNPLCAEAYYQSVGQEICLDLTKIDYLFVAVSSGGTIAGVSRRVKDAFPQCQVIAADVEGSVVFGGEPSRRPVPGVGSSIVPDQLKAARIDDVVICSSAEMVQGCRALLKQEAVFAGGSSGLVFAAIHKYFSRNPPPAGAVVATIFPDRGERYFDTIYNEDWVAENISATGRAMALSA